MNKIKYFNEKRIYDSYTWKKVSYSNFLSRVKKNMPFEVAILSWFLDRTYRKKSSTKIHNNKYLKYYSSYVWEKVSYSNFLYKIRQWLHPEIAIRKYTRVSRCKKERNRLVNVRKKKKSSFNQSYYLIEVTYDKDVANVFRNVYYEMLNNLQDKYHSSDNLREANLILKNINALKKEIEVFNQWNPL